MKTIYLYYVIKMSSLIDVAKDNEELKLLLSKMLSSSKYYVLTLDDISQITHRMITSVDDIRQLDQNNKVMYLESKVEQEIEKLDIIGYTCDWENAICKLYFDKYLSSEEKMNIRKKLEAIEYYDIIKFEIH